MRVSPAKSSELHFAPPSLNLFQPYETVEILEWVALLWILALTKARSAAPISAAISAKRATLASAKINATLEGARQKGSWLRRSFVTAHCGDAPHSLLATRPSASTRDPLQYFNSLLVCALPLALALALRREQFRLCEPISITKNSTYMNRQSGSSPGRLIF